MCNYLFTIYICTYNGAKTISPVLDALLEMHLIRKYVKKIIIVDNNSLDNTHSIVQQYLEHNEIISYEFESKQGLSFARQHSVNASTEWIIFLDDDNIVDEFWLINLLNSIEIANVGVINGSVIPLTTDLSNKDIEKLKIIYKDLACSHMNVQDIKDNHKLDHPYGAGMVVRKKALTYINENGWLNLIGRQGNILSSGEDGEMINKILQQGYIFVYNNKMIIHHIIPSQRLSIEYVERLYIGLTLACYELSSKNKFYVLNRIGKLLKAFIKYFHAFVYSKKNSIEYFRRKVILKTYFHAIKKDKLFGRKK